MKIFSVFRGKKNISSVFIKPFNGIFNYSLNKKTFARNFKNSLSDNSNFMKSINETIKNQSDKKDSNNSKNENDRTNDMKFKKERNDENFDLFKDKKFQRKGFNDEKDSYRQDKNEDQFNQSRHKNISEDSRKTDFNKKREFGFDRDTDNGFKSKRFERDSEEGFKPRRFDRDTDDGFKSKRFERHSDDGFKPRRFDKEEGFKPRRFERHSDDDFKPRRFDRETEDGFRPRKFERHSDDGFKPRRLDRDSDDGFKPRRFDRDSGFKPRRFDRDSEDGFKPRRYDRDSEEGFKPRRFDRDSEEGFKPRRFDRDSGFKPRRFERDTDEGFKPRRFDRDTDDGFKSKRFDRETEDGFRPRRFERNQDNGFKPRRFDRDSDNGFKPRRFDRDSDDGFKPRRFDRDYKDGNSIEKDFNEENKKSTNYISDKLTNDINSDDSELESILNKIDNEFKDKDEEQYSNEEVQNLKVPKVSFKSNDFFKSDSKINDEIEEDINNEILNKKVENIEKELDENFEITNKKTSSVFEYKEKKYEYIYGIHSVESALANSLRKKYDLMILINYKENTPDHIQKLINMAKSQNLGVKFLVREKLEKFTGNRPHNGAVLKCETREYIAVNNFEIFQNNYLKKQNGNFIVILDQIVDPQNFGSIIRTTFFLGADHLMVNRIRKTPISSGVAKVSSGASECINLFSLRSIKHFISDANKNNWIIINTSIEKEKDILMRGSYEKNDFENDEESPIFSNENKINKTQNISLSELKLNSKENVILIMGSEGFGVSKDLISNYINYNVYIPPMLEKNKINQHPFDIVDSLNVGVSAGIIVNHIATQLKNNENEIKI